jgi:hypothetical protein
MPEELEVDTGLSDNDMSDMFDETPAEGAEDIDESGDNLDTDESADDEPAADEDSGDEEPADEGDEPADEDSGDEEPADEGDEPGADDDSGDEERTKTFLKA